MNRQRKVLITTTYNELGIIIDTKAEEVAQPDLQQTCNQLATDCISRQAAIVVFENSGLDDDSKDTAVRVLEQLPSAQPQRKTGKWIKISPANIYECSECGKNVMTDDISAYDFCHGCGADMRGESDG